MPPLHILAQSAVTLDFGTVATWLAGILATIITAGICAACAFAWQAAMSLRDIKGHIHGIREAIDNAIEEIEDHENRLRRMEGRPTKRTRKDMEREALES